MLFVLTVFACQLSTIPLSACKIYVNLFCFYIPSHNYFHVPNQPVGPLRLMATVLINEKLINYLLTYILFRDHLELLFSAIRSAGGKNNPNGLQLRNILRTLLSHTDVVLGVRTNVNVVKQDNTTLLPINSIKLTHTANSKENNENNINIDYSISLSLFTEGIVEYIGGFVVKELLQAESCFLCREALVSTEICFQEFPIASPSLLNIKDLGGLHRPSKCVESNEMYRDPFMCLYRLTLH